MLSPLEYKRKVLETAPNAAKETFNSQTIVDEECNRVIYKYLRIGGQHLYVA